MIAVATTANTGDVSADEVIWEADAITYNTYRDRGHFFNMLNGDVRPATSTPLMPMATQGVFRFNAVYGPQVLFPSSDINPDRGILGSTYIYEYLNGKLTLYIGFAARLPDGTPISEEDRFTDIASYGLFLDLGVVRLDTMDCDSTSTMMCTMDG